MDEIQKHYAKCLQWVYFVLCKLYLNKTLKKVYDLKEKRKENLWRELQLYPEEHTL